MPFLSSRRNVEGVERGFIIFTFLTLLSTTGCENRGGDKWPPLHDILSYREHPPRISQEKVTIPEKQKDLILEWISKDRDFIDSLTLARFGNKPGDFRITRTSKNTDIVVRLFAPFIKEHKIYAGIQLFLLINKKTLNPRVAYISAVPWERL